MRWAHAILARLHLTCHCCYELLFRTFMCTFFFFIAVVIESTVFIVCTMFSVGRRHWNLDLTVGQQLQVMQRTHCPYKMFDIFSCFFYFSDAKLIPFLITVLCLAAWRWYKPLAACIAFFVSGTVPLLVDHTLPNWAAYSEDNLKLQATF